MENYIIGFPPNPSIIKRHRKHLRKQLKAMPRYIFDTLSEEVERNGGDVIKPSNDQVIGKWIRIRHKSQRLKKYQQKKAIKEF